MAPPPPPLPTLRMKEEPAFTYMGVDFTGPLSIRVTDLQVGSKVWVCIFTCYVTRALLLDVVPGQSTQMSKEICFR